MAIRIQETPFKAIMAQTVSIKITIMSPTIHLTTNCFPIIVIISITYLEATSKTATKFKAGPATTYSITKMALLITRT